ncbi:flavanone 3-dioxygenase 2-like isoform X2 [Tasmannia lanceolata]
MTSAAPSVLTGTAQPVTHNSSKGIKHLVDATPHLRSIPFNYILPVTSRPLPVSVASIPVIDLYGLEGPADSRTLTVQAISSACAHWGFFRIVNHGIKESLMEEMIRCIEGFFSLPWEEKAKYASDDVLSPVRYGTSLNTPVPHAHRYWRDFLRHFGHPFQNTLHLWPHFPPNYRQVAKEYLEEIWKMWLNLAGAISEGLGLERGYIQESLGEGCQILAANYYPPCPEPHLTLGLSAHSDHGGLTILLQNDVEGLQVRHEDEWVQVPHIPGTFVVNIGDYLEILSNGRYKSVEHRAMVNEKRTRISIAVGHGPELAAMVAPASQLVEENGGPKYRPITYRDYMRCQQSSVSRGKSPLEAILMNSST